MRHEPVPLCIACCSRWHGSILLLLLGNICCRRFVARCGYRRRSERRGDPRRPSLILLLRSSGSSSRGRSSRNDRLDWGSRKSRSVLESPSDARVAFSRKCGDHALLPRLAVGLDGTLRGPERCRCLEKLGRREVLRVKERGEARGAEESSHKPGRRVGMRSMICLSSSMPSSLREGERWT